VAKIAELYRILVSRDEIDREIIQDRRWSCSALKPSSPAPSVETHRHHQKASQRCWIEHPRRR